LRYAELLADFGYEDLAREYLLSIRSCIGLDSDKRKGGKASAAASGNSVYDLEFIESLKRLDDRICGSTGAEPSSWDNKDDRRGSLAAVGSIVKSVLGKKPKTEEVPPLSKTNNKPKSTEKSQMEEEVVDESPREVAQLSMPPQQSFPTPVNAQATNDILDTTLEGDESFITTKTSFEKAAADAPEEAQQEDRPKSPTTLLSNPFSHNMGKPNDEQQQQDAPSSAPPMFSLDQETKPKEEVKKKMETILSTPVSKKKEDKEKAPVSEPPSKYTSIFVFYFLGRCLTYIFLIFQLQEVPDGCQSYLERNLIQTLKPRLLMSEKRCRHIMMRNLSVGSSLVMILQRWPSHWHLHQSFPRLLMLLPPHQHWRQLLPVMIRWRL